MLELAFDEVELDAPRHFSWETQASLGWMAPPRQGPLPITYWSKVSEHLVRVGSVRDEVEGKALGD